MLDEDFVIGSYLIPAGTIVRTAHSGIHMHEKIWDKPVKLFFDKFFLINITVLNVV